MKYLIYEMCVKLITKISDELMIEMMSFDNIEMFTFESVNVSSFSQHVYFPMSASSLNFHIHQFLFYLYHLVGINKVLVLLFENFKLIDKYIVLYGDLFMIRKSSLGHIEDINFIEHSRSCDKYLQLENKILNQKTIVTRS